MSFLGKRRSYLGSGVLQSKLYGVAGGYASMGAQQSISLGYEFDDKRQSNTQRPGGGTRNVVRRITQGKMSVELMDFSLANLALAFLGDMSTVAAGTVTAVDYTAYTDALVPLAHVSPTSVVVKDSTEVITYVAGTDYEVWESGLYILGSGAITDAQALKVSYSYGAQEVLEMIMNSGKEYSLIFSGLNEAESDVAGVLYVHRAKPSPAQEWQLIGDDFGTLQIEFELLQDSTKGAGESAYARFIQQALAA